MTNHISISGNLVADGKLIGDKYASFTIAHNTNKKDNNTGGWITTNTSFYDVLVNSNIYNVANLKKGTPIEITGSIQIREKDGFKNVSIFATSLAVIPGGDYKIPGLD